MGVFVFFVTGEKSQKDEWSDWEKRPTYAKATARQAWKGPSRTGISCEGNSER